MRRFKNWQIAYGSWKTVSAHPIPRTPMNNTLSFQRIYYASKHPYNEKV